MFAVESVYISRKVHYVSKWFC